jgi:hypothetical protein
MSYDEVNDDYASMGKPYRVIACMPVHGRLPLLKHTIERLYKKNGCYRVICSGDGVEEKKLCESWGAVWVHSENNPLGLKWNRAFQKAKDLDPDACLFVGSSDWLCDDWVKLMRPYSDVHGFAGVPGCYLVDLNQPFRGVLWPGYKGWRHERADETIGIGRLLSRRLLKSLDWQPFDPLLDNSLDWSMKMRAKQFGYHDFMVHDDKLKALSLSFVGRWDNKHKFEDHWSGKIPSKRIDAQEFVDSYFPEVNRI